MTWFDGLPVATDGELNGCDARELARHWSGLDTRLEGQFSAARVDLEAETAELLLDALGLAQVFVARRDGGVLVSNSAGLVSSLLDLSSPDPLAVSSMLGLGWAAGGRTMNLGVSALSGGARHRIRGGTVQTSRHFGPETIARQPRIPTGERELAETLSILTANAVRGIDRVGCPLTGGRDTRVLAALLQATGRDALYFTGGAPSHPDVVIAQELAHKLGIRHEAVYYDEPESTELDWTDAAARFMRRNDGLVSLLQLGDYIDLSPPLPPLGVKLWGVGGEIGRSGGDLLSATATNVPVLRSSPAVQRRLLATKTRDEASLMEPAARQEVLGYLDRFTLERLGEGWRPREIFEAFYTFERVGCWGATGPRRMAGTDDIFGPFCSRPFISHCFSLSSAERLVERSHWGLLTELSPSLRDHRFITPFPRPRPRWAAAIATLTFARAVAKQAPRPTLRSARPGAPARPQAQYRLQHAWFEARLEMMRELFSVRDSELWNFVSRPRIDALLAGSEADRARNQEGLLRAATVFWHFHGMRPEPRPDLSHTADGRSGLDPSRSVGQ